MAKKDIFDEADSGSEDIGADADGTGLKINEEYARRFEHNKKREERQRRKWPAVDLSSETISNDCFIFACVLAADSQ